MHLPSLIMRYFDTEGLPPIQTAVAAEFRGLADSIDRNVPPGPEKSVCLRKLLEAKDAAIRATMDLM